MKTLLLSFVLAISFNSSAQTYDLLPDSCTFCSFQYTDGLGNFLLAAYSIDPDQTSFVNSETYIDFNAPNNGYQPIGYRQSGNQLIGLIGVALTEVLIMDFDANVGDTIYNLFSEGTTYNAVVTSKDSSLLIGGDYHHFMHLEGFEYYNSMGNLSIGQVWPIEWNERMLCGQSGTGGIIYNMFDYWYQGISGVYYFPQWCTSDPRYNNPVVVSCQNCQLIREDAGIEETTYGIKVFPNPASSELNIDLNNAGFTSANIKLTNLLGEVVVNTQLQSNINSIGIEHLTSGVYFISIETITEVILQEKIVIR
jgi:hypothetical protein